MTKSTAKKKRELRVLLLTQRVKRETLDKIDRLAPRYGGKGKTIDAMSERMPE